MPAMWPRSSGALVQTGITSSFETTPVVVNGVMYATTPVVDSKMKILAIRADSGDIIWESTYSLVISKSAAAQSIGVWQSGMGVSMS